VSRQQQAPHLVWCLLPLIPAITLPQPDARPWHGSMMTPAAPVGRVGVHAPPPTPGRDMCLCRRHKAQVFSQADDAIMLRAYLDHCVERGPDKPMAWAHALERGRLAGIGDKNLEVRPRLAEARGGRQQWMQTGRPPSRTACTACNTPPS